MQMFQNGELVEFKAKYSINNPSPWTGKRILILECLDENPFYDDQSESEQIYLAERVRYRVAVERNIVLMNHLCFVENDNFVAWKVIESGDPTHFLY